MPGDGIGVDVTAEAVETLRLAAAKDGFAVEIEEMPVGAGEYLRNGDPLPAGVMARLDEFDAILLGAMGLPNVRWPSGVEMTPQLDLREKLELYYGSRPIYLYHADDSPLRGRQAGDIDFVLVRESTEGLFHSRKSQHSPDADHVDDVMRITRRGAERVIRRAYEEARGRRKHLTLIDKANVLPSMAYFRSIFNRVGEGYPDVEKAHVYVDAAALYLVQKPQMFDVMVTENMFGDILSDLAAALVGGMGMAPSADIGDRHAVFQPSHGSAPDIAGKGWANPVATILSAAMMLEWLGGPEAGAGARRIRDAVKAVFADRASRTRDMGGTMSTAEMGSAIRSAMA
jgi:3-isopropylmalate dehydrogenase